MSTRANETSGRTGPRRDARGVSIREMRGDDLPAVLETERASFTMPWSEETFRGLLGRNDAELVVAESADGELVGHAVFWAVLDQGELGNIAVAPERRGRGVGTRLLEAVFDRARRHGVRDLYLEVRASNESAQHLYRGHGFRAVGRRRTYYTAPVEDAVVMKKRIDA